jgi:hypothetical protein
LFVNFLVFVPSPACSPVVLLANRRFSIGKELKPSLFSQDVAKYTVEHPSAAVRPRLGVPSQLNTTCLAIPGKYEAAPAYFNGVSVFDTKLSVFGSITSSGIVPPGCPSGLPINCFSPQVALLKDSMWVTGGECDPAVIGAKQYWHYPTVTLFGSLSLTAARLKSDDDDDVSLSVTHVAHPHLKYMS